MRHPLLVWLAAPGLILTSACSTVTPEGQPVDLAFAYQVNLELIDLLGPFYHRRQQFPEVRAVTDVAAVKLDRALETPEQEPTDFNLFVLDGRTGTLLFSRGTKTLAAVSDPSLKAARALAVTRQGRLAVIDAQGRVDTCWSFDGSATTRAASCQASAVEARDVAAWSDGSVFVLTAGGGLVALDPVSGTTASVRLRPQTPATAVGLRADGHHLLLVHDGGYALSAFAERGCAGGGHGSGAPAGPPFVFTRVAKARDIPALFDYGPGPGPAPAPPAPPQRRSSALWRARCAATITRWRTTACCASTATCGRSSRSSSRACRSRSGGWRGSMASTTRPRPTCCTCSTRVP